MKMSDQEKQPQNSKMMHVGMWVCCAVMLLPLLVFFAQGGSFWLAGQFGRSSPNRPLPRRTWRDVFLGEILPWRSKGIKERRARRRRNPSPNIEGCLTFYQLEAPFLCFEREGAP